MRRQKLVFITGAPSIGKTTAGEALKGLLDDAAFLDGDWLWHVHPFSLDDRRLRNGDASMSFALDTYLSSDFEYVIFSSVILVDGTIRTALLERIASGGYELYCFHLKGSRETLRERHATLGEDYEPAYEWLDIVPLHGDLVLQTDGKSARDIANEIKVHVDGIPGAVHRPEMVKLFTDEMVLRTVSSRDAEEVARRMNIDGTSLSPEEAAREIAWMEDNHRALGTAEWKHLCLAMIDKKEREIVGWCGLDNRNPERDSPALFYLVHEEARGKGYATQAARAAIDYGFEALALPKVHAGVDLDNAASLKVAAKLGMERLGLDKEGGAHFELRAGAAP